MKYLCTTLITLCLHGQILPQETIFEDVTQRAGVAENGRNWGVAFGDFDGDTFEDILVTRFEQSNRFYRNLGDGTFEELSQNVGLNLNRRNGMPLWGDINNDGRLDLYLAGLDEPNFLFLNRGSEGLTNITETASVGDSHKTEAVAFTDFDLDGFVDLFLFNRAAENVLYRNKGDLTFERMLSAGLSGRLNAMGLAFADYDNDGDQDVYLVYDGHQANNLYRNNGDGTFTDVAGSAGVALRAEGMAPAFADFDNDGLLDLYVTNLGANVLYNNNGDGTFTDVTTRAGAGDPGMGWGLTWLDYDNDGWLDLYVVNASSFNSPPDPNVLYHNNHDGTFTIVNENDPTRSLASGFGSACADIDHDGCLDLFITNQDRHNQLFLNKGGGNHWIAVQLIGTTSNRDAVGACVTLRAGNLQQTREVSSACGWVSQNSLLLHVGLAENTVVEEITVTWPTRPPLVESFFDIRADQYVTITERVGIVTSVEKRGAKALPQEYALSRSYPNPFYAGTDRIGSPKGGTTIHYTIGGNSARVTEIAVFNILGQQVRSLVRGVKPPGTHSVQWDGRNAHGHESSKGIYFVRMISGPFIQSQKVLLLR
ncbi:MAG: FG-GAP-like repeat-containing protein [bacterium]